MSVENIVAETLVGLNSNNDSLIPGSKEEQTAPRTKTQQEMLKQKAKEKSMRGKRAKENHNFPVEPTVIQVIKKPRTYMNHSYRDFSKVPAEIGHAVPADFKQRSFPQQVHDILSQEEFENIISWMPHGRAFRVHVPKLLERRVLQKYFGHTRFSSFLRQLSNYGFKHITKGRDRNCYYHEFMLRGLPHLCKYMPRPKDARRLIPDPDNEPDFYSITKMYPLPGDKPQEDDAKKPKSKKPKGSIPEVITTFSVPEEPVSKANELPVNNLLAAAQPSATPNLMGHTANQMAWLENRINPMRSSLHSSILGLTAAQPQLPPAGLIVPPNSLATAAVQPSWSSVSHSAALLERNAAVLAALQVQQMPNLGMPGLVPTDNLAALLQSRMQQQRSQFGPF